MQQPHWPRSSTDCRPDLYFTGETIILQANGVPRDEQILNLSQLTAFTHTLAEAACRAALSCGPSKSGKPEMATMLCGKVCEHVWQMAAFWQICKASLLYFQRDVSCSAMQHHVTPKQLVFQQVSFYTSACTQSFYAVLKDAGTGSLSMLCFSTAKIVRKTHIVALELEK